MKSFRFSLVVFGILTCAPLGNEGIAGGWFDYAVLRFGAELGNADAQLDLGGMYEQGDWVRKSYGIAAHWYQKAAEQGVEEAQLRLAALYVEGRGMGRNLAQAYALYDLAAMKGNKVAEERRETLARRISPAEFEQGRQLAREWIRKISGVKE